MGGAGRLAGRRQKGTGAASDSGGGQGASNRILLLQQALLQQQQPRRRGQQQAQPSALLDQSIVNPPCWPVSEMLPALPALSLCSVLCNYGPRYELLRSKLAAAFPRLQVVADTSVRNGGAEGGTRGRRRVGGSDAPLQRAALQPAALSCACADALVRRTGVREPSK